MTVPARTSKYSLNKMFTRAIQKLTSVVLKTFFEQHVYEGYLETNFCLDFLFNQENVVGGTIILFYF